MSNSLDPRQIERTVDRLPEEILVNGKVHRLGYRYFGGLDDYWTLGYSTDEPHPKKEVFIFRDESTLERCVFGAWRILALKKNEWKFVDDKPWWRFWL